MYETRVTTLLVETTLGLESSQSEYSCLGLGQA
jgi:hypothetical protein